MRDEPEEILSKALLKKFRVSSSRRSMSSLKCAIWRQASRKALGDERPRHGGKKAFDGRES